MPVYRRKKARRSASQDPTAREYIIDLSIGLTREMRAAIGKTRERVAGIIDRAGRNRFIATSAKARKEAFARILDEYRALAVRMGGTFGAGVDAQSGRVARHVAGTLPGKAAPHPLTDEQKTVALNGRTASRLVAVATENMGESGVRKLRAAAVEVFRDASVNGWTDNEIHKRLQERWSELAGDDNAFRFVDRAGHEWENARYLQMLTRTTMATISRNQEINTLTKNGYDLAQISGDAGDETCDICAEWEGKVISLTGATKGFPTLADAEADGLFHPNCIHRIEYIGDDEARELMGL